ncbi:hypothetical protein KFE25_012125 [Diacronema lutheri]|uniref:Uncharacterized protein n=2 Tax=Diacronema lutheri TaxID=2081491 RepID=A0A8J6CA67_DIALT|nr:hypothetical protein KFE25_012125 [Diacronema lutheri]
MGKAQKRARCVRALPYARPENAMDTDEALAPVDKAGKPLSAHMQKVVERKRLQAQIKDIALQRRKIKGGDKKVVKMKKKELSKQIQSSKMQRQSLQSFVQAQRAREAEEPRAATAGDAGSFQFSLPLKPVAIDPEFLPAR